MNINFELIGTNDKWPHISNMEVYKQKHVNFVSIGKGDSENLHSDFDLCNKISGNYYFFSETSESKKYMDSIRDFLSAPNISYNKEMLEKLNYNFFNKNTICSLEISNLDDFLHTMDQIDICKLDLNDEYHSRLTLYKLLDRGFRPSILYIRCKEVPETYAPTRLCVGHLQNCGYSLMSIHENKYIYYYTDKCLYDTIYWENPSLDNPLETTIKQKAFLELANKTIQYLNDKLNPDDLQNCTEYLANIMGAKIHKKTSN